jgi:4-hydroxy-2-oxoheptanedioate aldolase
MRPTRQITRLSEKAAALGSDAVCAVLGISTLALADLDLSFDLGCPGRFDAPEILEAVRNSTGA